MQLAGQRGKCAETRWLTERSESPFQRIGPFFDDLPRRGDALLSPAITKRVIKQFTRIARLATPKELGELTAREHDILRLIADGLSNAGDRRQLYISETTVKTHVTHSLQKLGLRDRVQAVLLAYQAGLTPPLRP